MLGFTTGAIAAGANVHSRNEMEATEIKVLRIVPCWACAWSWGPWPGCHRWPLHCRGSGSWCRLHRRWRLILQVGRTRTSVMMIRDRRIYSHTHPAAIRMFTFHRYQILEALANSHLDWSHNSHHKTNCKTIISFHVIHVAELSVAET